MPEIAILILAALPFLQLGDGTSIPKLSLFLGRFHPTLLHLPVAFLLLALLLELARLRRDQAVGAHRDSPLPEALSLGQGALEIADRCGYRLQQADCHNFLAQLALRAGNPDEARHHAEAARDCAECDGPGHRYEVAYQEAERLLAEC